MGLFSDLNPGIVRATEEAGELSGHLGTLGENA